MPPPPPTTQDSELRDRILSAAKRIFLEGSSDAPTMDAVAQTAGMSKKTIYREFSSQLELMVALLKENKSDFGPVAPPDPDRSLEDQLSDLIVSVVSFVLGPRQMALIRLIISEIRRYPELLEEHKERGLPVEVVAEWFRHEAVRARYEIDDPEEAAAMVVGMIVQDAPIKLIFLPKEVLSTKDLERRTKVAVRIFLRGLERAG